MHLFTPPLAPHFPPLSFRTIDAAQRVQECLDQLLNEVRELNWQFGQLALAGEMTTQEASDATKAVRALARVVGGIDLVVCRVEPFLTRAALERLDADTQFEPSPNGPDAPPR